MSKKNDIKNMFDSISHKYDFLNHFLSVGIDFYWRKKALKYTKLKKDYTLLDVACGTGDFSIAAKKVTSGKIYGADLSFGMLKYFPTKADWIKGRLAQSVAEHLPFKENIFTNIIVAFGVRNFYNINEGFNSFFRVLKDGGKVTILEFGLPKNQLIKSTYLFYFNKILPAIGRVISKDQSAYTYLPKSVSAFDTKVDLKKELTDVGFKNIEVYSLTFGLVQIVIGEK